MICEWTVNLLGTPEDYRVGQQTRLSVTSNDWANESGEESGLTWPSDETITAETSRLIGVPVTICNRDAGDHPTLVEEIYTVALAL